MITKKFTPCEAPGCKRPAFSHKYCDFPSHQNLRTDAEWIRRQQKKAEKPVKVYQMRRRSKKREADEREYNKEVKIFLALPENRYCRVYPKLRATQVHHQWGRENERLLDKRYWLPVSDPGHDFINNNPEKAFEMKYSLYRNQDSEKQL